jgi:hypothetical protein
MSDNSLDDARVTVRARMRHPKRTSSRRAAKAGKARRKGGLGDLSSADPEVTQPSARERVKPPHAPSVRRESFGDAVHCWRGYKTEMLSPGATCVVRFWLSDRRAYNIDSVWLSWHRRIRICHRNKQRERRRPLPDMLRAPRRPEPISVGRAPGVGRWGIRGERAGPPRSGAWQRPRHLGGG